MTDEALDFGARLKRIRKGRGLTQRQFGQAVGLSQRMVTYYESQGGQPPAPLLAKLAQALRISADELLGLKPLPTQTDPQTAKLMKRLAQAQHLPPADQRAVLQHLDALLTARGKDRNVS